jgi:hypothetical protein
MNERTTMPRVSRLKDQGSEGDLAGTTAAEQIGKVWRLTLRAWALTGQPNLDAPMRRDMVRVIRRGHGSSQNAAAYCTLV